MMHSTVAPSVSDRSAQRSLIVLLMDEQSLVWREGKGVSVEEFLKRHPHLAGNAEAVLDLIYNEVVQRQKRGEQPNLDEYTRRFPHLTDPLRVQFEVHSALEAGSVPEAKLVRWFVARGREKVGPFDLEALRSLARDGSLKEKDMVLPEGGSKWGPARDVPGLFASPSADTTRGGFSSVAVGTETRSFIPDTLSPSQSPETFVPRASSGIPGLPGYELLGELGRGGMGVVYKARQTALKRLVALKMILSRGHVSSGELERFQAEAEAVARLQHPHIVQIYEVGRQGEQPYFSLEFVDGGSLDRKIAGTPQAPRDSAALLEQIARAMYAAHQAGVIHRDLKPANILLARPTPEQAKEGQEPSLGEFVPKISDFGLAKRLDESGQTVEGAIMGTPSYMSPEQARGKINQLGPATDIWALGAILYELLTGRPPFKGRNVPDTLVLVQTGEPVPPRQLAPQTPFDLETICLKCLHKEPGKRYASALEFAQDLRRFLHHEPIKARPVGKVERVYRWARRNPALAAVLSLLVLSLVGGVSGILWQFGIALDNAQQAQKEKTIARDEEAKAKNAQLLAEENAEGWHYKNYVAVMNLVAQARERGDLSTMQRLLRDYIPRPGEKDHRDFVWHYYWQLMRGSRLLLEGHDSTVNLLTYSQEGSFLASSGHDRTVRVWDTREGKQHWEKPITLPYAARDLAFSPDAKYLAVVMRVEGRVHVVDVAKGTILDSLKVESCSCVAYSPDGKNLVIGTGRGKIEFYDSVGGRKFSEVSPATPIYSLCFSHDGSFLFSAGQDGRARAWKVEGTGESVKVAVLAVSTGPTIDYNVKLSAAADVYTVFAAGQDNVLLSMSWGEAFPPLKHPPNLVGRHSGKLTAVAAVDGLRVATVGEDAQIQLWKTLTASPGGRLAGHLLPIRAVAASSDGTQLATADDAGIIRVWEIQNAVSDLPEKVGNPPGFALTPDLLKPPGDTHFELFSEELGSPYLWRGKGGRIRKLAFSPTEDLLASSGEDGFLRIWDAATGESRTRINYGSYPVQAFAFHPDGKSLRVGTNSGGLATVNVANGRRIKKGIGILPDKIAAMAVSPDGTIAFLGSSTGRVEARPDDPDKTVFHRGSIHHSRISSAAYAPDGKQVAMASDEGLLGLYEVGGGGGHVLTGHTTGITAMAYMPGGQHVISSDRSGRTIMTSRDGTQVILENRSLPHLDVAASPDGKTLYWATQYGSAGDLTLWTDVALPRYKEEKGIPIFQKPAVALAVDRTGKRVALGSADGTLAIWDVEKKRVVTRWAGHALAVNAVSCAPDGKMLATGGANFVVKLIDAKTAEVKEWVTGHTDVITALAHSPDSATLASASQDGTIRLWDARSGEERATWKTPSSVPALCLAFAPDGKTLVAGGGTVRTNGYLTLWDVATGKARLRLNGHRWMVQGVAVVRGGNLLASVSGTGWDYPGEIKLWDLASGRELASAGGHRAAILTLALAPDGRSLATGGSAGDVRLWDISDPKNLLRPLGRMDGHDGGVRGLSFLDNGRTLASNGDDATLRFWHTELGEPMGTTRLRTAALCQAVDPSGSVLYLGRRDGVVERCTGVSKAELAIELRHALDDREPEREMGGETQRLRAEYLRLVANHKRGEKNQDITRQTLDECARVLEGLSTKRKEDDFLRRDRIEVLLELAERGDKNRLVEAEAAARTARELIEKTPFTPDGKADFTRLRLRSIRVHAECLTALGRVKEARAITEEALKWIETLYLNPTERIERSEIIEESTLLHLQNYRSMRPAEFDEDMRFKVSGTVFQMKGRERTWRGPSDYWKTMTALLELETSFTENHINIRISYLHELATVLECRTHRNPHDLALREAKARAYGKLGDVAYEEGRRWISSHGYWRAIAAWESLRISQPRHVETWTEVGWSMDRLGHMSLHEKRPDEARTRVHQAIALQKVARNLDPGNQRCLELLVGHLHLLIECCLALNDHGEAVETVKYLATLEKETAASRRRLAGLMAQGAAMVGVDTKLKPEERRAKSNEYADEAMRFLTRAVTLGHKDRADLQKAADLASLHTRDDFKALLNSLDRGKP